MKKFPQQRHIYLISLLNNTTNTGRRTQSILSPTEWRIFATINPFRTFYSSLHESVAIDTSSRLLLFIHNLLPSLIFCNLFSSFLIQFIFSSYQVFVIELLK